MWENTAVVGIETIPAKFQNRLKRSLSLSLSLSFVDIVAGHVIVDRRRFIVSVVVIVVVIVVYI